MKNQKNKKSQTADLTRDDDRSDDRNERNIDQRAPEPVPLQMIPKSVTPHTRKARDQSERHQYISGRYEDRQRQD